MKRHCCEDSQFKFCESVLKFSTNMDLTFGEGWKYFSFLLSNLQWNFTSYKLHSTYTNLIIIYYVKKFLNLITTISELIITKNNKHNNENIIH